MAITKKAPVVVLNTEGQDWTGPSSNLISAGPGFSPPGTQIETPKWQEVETEFTTRAVAMIIWGSTDTGRTTLALSAPGPIAYIHSHEKVDGLIQNARRNKIIRVHKFSGLMTGDVNQLQVLAERERLEFEAMIRDAYSWARTIIIDTESRAWEMYQLARLGTQMREEMNESDKKKGQLIYTEINARWQSMLQTYRVELEKPRTKEKPFQTNLILVAKTTEEYKKKDAASKVKEGTGKMIRKGQKDTDYFADVTLKTVREGVTFKAICEKPWWNNQYRNYAFTDGDLSFPAIMSKITNTDILEWWE